MSGEGGARASGGGRASPRVRRRRSSRVRQRRSSCPADVELVRPARMSGEGRARASGGGGASPRVRWRRSSRVRRRQSLRVQRQRGGGPVGDRGNRDTTAPIAEDFAVAEVVSLATVTEAAPHHNDGTRDGGRSWLPLPRPAPVTEVTSATKVLWPASTVTMHARTKKKIGLDETKGASQWEFRRVSRPW